MYSLEQVIGKASSTQAKISPFCRRLSAIFHSQLLNDIADVLFSRGHGNDQFLSNILIGRSAGDQLQNLKLALAERFDEGVAG